MNLVCAEQAYIRCSEGGGDMAFSLYCRPYPYSYTVGLLPILLAFSLYEPLSIVHLCSTYVPLFTMCIADLWDTHTTHLDCVDTQCSSSTGGSQVSP